MKQPAHTIEIESPESLNLGTRVMLEAASALLWPLKPDDRMTVLITLLAGAIGAVAANEDEIDAIVDMLRMQMKLELTPRQAN
jgi:hypothetical protein